jgi:hypothetical protein
MNAIVAYMNTKNTVRIVSSILVILIVIVGVLLWSRSHGSTAFTSRFGYTIQVPAGYSAYEDANGMVAFPVLKYAAASSTAATSTLDYHATYAVNSTGFSIVAMIPNPDMVPTIFDLMTQTQATSTETLPQGALFMRSGPITPSDSKSAEGAYRGTNYSFRTARGAYFLNVFSTDPNGDAARTELARQVLSSFRER